MGDILSEDGGTSAIIVIMLVVLALFAVLIIGRFKRYSDGAKAAGNEIMTLARPVKNVISSAIFYIVIAYVLSGHGISSGGIDLSSILVLAIGAINISFDIKPQVLCEYGIVTSNGLIPWELVEEIEGVNEKDQVIHLRLDEIMKKNTNMKVFCPSEEVDKVMAIIESRMKKAEDRETVE